MASQNRPLKARRRLTGTTWRVATFAVALLACAMPAASAGDSRSDSPARRAQSLMNGVKQPVLAAVTTASRRRAGTGDLELAKADGDEPDKGREADQEATGLAGDWGAIALLLLLYTLQGVPMGLSGSLPMLFQERGVTTMEQAVFSTVAYPFAFKLLWAPLVDSVYIPKFGRRKTWIVPAQTAIGVLLLTSSRYVNGLLGM